MVFFLFFRNSIDKIQNIHLSRQINDELIVMMPNSCYLKNKLCDFFDEIKILSKKIR